MLILPITILVYIVFLFLKSKKTNDNNIIKNGIKNIPTLIIYFLAYLFVITIISFIALALIASSSGSSDSGTGWVITYFSIVLGIILSPILSLITTIRLNRKKENITITNQKKLVVCDNTSTIRQKFNSENWFYLILFIILNISFSLIVTTESVAKSLIFILYSFIVLYIPIILLIILNIKKKKQNLFKVYLTCTLLIIFFPFMLNVILSLLDLRAWTIIIKLLLSLGAMIYIIFQIFQKNIDVNDNDIEIRQDDFNNIVKTNIPVNNKNNLYKIITLIFYNCIIVYLLLSTDFSDWGGLIIGPVVSLMILIGNPILTWILFRKNDNKGKIIFISFISTIILTSAVGFFGNPDNINNLIENNKEDKEIKTILNDTNNNIEIYSNDEFKMLINSNKECVYLIFNQKQNGYNSNVSVQRNYKLLTLKLVQTSISENTFNEHLLFTKNINNENEDITMNIKYKTIDNKEDNQVIFGVNDKYYIFENDGIGWMFNNILKENNILQEKIFSIIENETIYKEEDKFDFYSDETFDYLILDQKKGYKYEYYQTYKCDFENKSNSERLKEFLRYIDYYKYRSFDEGEYNEYIIKNGKIEKIIIYESGGILSWIEIFPRNFEKSLFVEVINFPNKEERTIKDSVSFQNGTYDISDGLDNDKNFGSDIKIDEKAAKDKIKKEFDDLLDNNFVSINDLKLNEDYSTINSIELLIITNNVPNNEIDFCNKLIEAYNDIKGLLNKYNYTSQNIHFKFTNNNPFAKEESINYRNSGYMRVGEYIDSDSNWYNIYLNPTPIKIN